MNDMKKILFLLALAAALLSCKKEEPYVDDGTYAMEHQDPSIAIDMGVAGKWAPMNVGAKKPSEHGYYLSWGEIEPKTVYSWGTYRYGTENNFTKYSKKDKKRDLAPGDDAATVRWGTSWRTPTPDEWNKLIDNCTNEFTTLDGVYGYMLTAPNGHQLFLPSGGHRKGEFQVAPTQGSYWTTKCSDPTRDGSLGYTVGFSELGLFRCSGGGTERCNGLAVRAILVE